MAEIITNIPDTIVTSMFPPLEIAWTEGLLFVEFLLLHGATPILQERYYSPQKRVQIPSIGDIIADQIATGNGKETIEIEAYFEIHLNGIKKRQFYAIKSKAMLPQSFNPMGNFLSLLNGPKRVKLNTQEHIAMLLDDSIPGPVIITYNRYNLESKEMEYKQQLIPYSIHEPTILHIPIPLDSPGDEIILSSVDVTLSNDITRSYIIDRDLDQAPTIQFRNSFGVMETFYPQGLIINEPSLKSNFGYFNDIYLTTYKSMQEDIKINTGEITKQEASWIKDLILSEEVYIIESNRETPITITEISAPISNDTTKEISFEIKARLSKRDNFFVDRVSELFQVFDSSFDTTFQ